MRNTEVRNTGVTQGPGGARLGTRARLPLRVIGAGLLFASAAIHLDLYKTGYRTIPTIGPLFLFQVIAAIVLGALVLLTGSRLIAGLAALFSLATLGGYLLSLKFGLFGFREVRTGSGIAAAILEILAFAVLAELALARASMVGRAVAGRLRSLERFGGQMRAARREQREPGGVHRPEHRRPGLAEAAHRAGNVGLSPLQAAIGAGLLSLVAFGLLGAALAGAGRHTGTSSPGTGTYGRNQAAGGALRTHVISGKTVLTDASGKTLYWFAPDKPNKSVCTGACAAYWPPAPGSATAPSGVPGKFATIARPGGGGTQETYNGHPLYTYIGDTGPGQARGNDVNLNGGYWYEMVVSGS